MGGHLRKRRYESGLTQEQAAKQLSVNTWTYLLWEQDRTTPGIRHYPVIFAFLGYNPFAQPTTLAARIASKRRELGLPISQAAKLAGVDEGTFARWENGEWEPRMSQANVDRFLAIMPPPMLLRSAGDPA